MKNFLVLLLAFVLAGGVVFFALTKKNPQVSPISENKNSKTTKITSPTVMPENKVYEDPAGFIFKYDSGLILAKKQLTDRDYSNIELSYPGKMGKITFKVSDSPYKNLNEWNKKGETAKFADLDAKKAVNTKGIQIAAQDKDAVFYLLTSDFAGEKDFWENEIRLISDTFKFQNKSDNKELSTGSQNESPPQNDTSVEEEIVE